MKSVPLYAKILVWFFLNLLLLAVGFWVVVRPEVRLETLVAGSAGDRLQGVADLIFAELRDRPASSWDETLERFGAAHGIAFAAADESGRRLAGPDLAMPPEVIDRLPHRGPGGPPSSGWEGGRERRGPPGQRPPGDEAAPPRFRGGPGPAGFRRLVRTRNPDFYWFIASGMVPAQDSPRPQLVRLVARSTTLAFGGLFLDATPWLLAGAGVFAFSVLWWLPFVGGITRSLKQTTAATQQIAEGRFDVRIPDTRRDELGSLSRSVNRMAERLDGFVTGQRRFLGDIAHELCAPLARIQMAIGILEQRADERQQAYVEDLREEVQHMSGLVNELLSFSKASLGSRTTTLQPVVLRDVAERALQRERSETAIPLEVRIDPGLRALAEPELLTRALSNLVRNAIRYAGADGPISLTGRLDGDAVVVTVADSGPGVPAEALTRIFEPFYRLDESRARETGGVGLGLAIVKTCITACQGTVEAFNRAPRGLEVVIRLAAAPLMAAGDDTVNAKSGIPGCSSTPPVGPG